MRKNPHNYFSMDDTLHIISPAVRAAWLSRFLILRFLNILLSPITTLPAASIAMPMTAPVPSPFANVENLPCINTASHHFYADII